MAIQTWPPNLATHLLAAWAWASDCISISSYKHKSSNSPWLECRLSRRFHMEATSISVRVESG